MVYGKLNLYYLIIFHNIQIIFTTRKSLKFYCTKFLPFEKKKNENNIKTFTTRHIALTKEFLHALIRCNKIIVNSCSVKKFRVQIGIFVPLMFL